MRMEDIKIKGRTDHRNSGHRKSSRVATLGLLASIAIILGYVEAMIPFNFGIPGMKLGLSNLALVFVLYRYSWKEAVPISAIRVLVIGFLFGNLFSIAYGMAGAMLSMMVMSLLKRTGLFTPAGVSAAGGAAHNIGQLLIAWLVTPSLPLLWYLPILILVGVLTGTLIGVVAGMVLQRVDFRFRF